MTRLTLLLWLLNVTVDTVGQLAFKAAARDSVGHSGLRQWRVMLKRPWIWLGVGSYALEFVLWLAFLALVPLSVGVMLGSINVVVIMLAGRLWFNEALSRWRLAGMLLIAAGVGVVGIG